MRPFTNEVRKHPLGPLLHRRPLQLPDSLNVIIEYPRVYSHLGLLTYPARDKNALQIRQPFHARSERCIGDPKVAATPAFHFRPGKKLPCKFGVLPTADRARFHVALPNGL